MRVLLFSVFFGRPKSSANNVLRWLQERGREVRMHVCVRPRLCAQHETELQISYCVYHHGGNNDGSLYIKPWCRFLVLAVTLHAT